MSSRSSWQWIRLIIFLLLAGILLLAGLLFIPQASDFEQAQFVPVGIVSHQQANFQIDPTASPRPGVEMSLIWDAVQDKNPDISTTELAQRKTNLNNALLTPVPTVTPAGNGCTGIHTIYAASDTWVDNTQPDTAQGQTPTLHLRQNKTDSQQILLYFPITDELAPFTPIISARLELNSEMQAGVFPTAPMKLFNLNAAFSESTTWNTLPPAGVPYGITPGTDGVRHHWDVTPIVRDWLSLRYANNGILITLPDGSTFESIYTSRESTADNSTHPRLIVDCGLGLPQMIAAVTATALPPTAVPAQPTATIAPPTPTKAVPKITPTTAPPTTTPAITPAPLILPTPPPSTATPLPAPVTFTPAPIPTPLPSPVTFTPTPANTSAPPTPTFTSVPSTSTPTPTFTPVPPTNAPTPTFTPVPSTSTPTPTFTPVPSTSTPTPTFTPVPPTNAPTPTFTPVPSTSTPTPTFTPVPPTSTPTPTFTPVPPTSTPTPTFTPVPPTSTPTPTFTPVPPTSTPTPTFTPVPPTSTPTPTFTPVPPVFADLTIRKTDNPDPVSVGQPLTYTLTITNLGPSTATNVIVTDTLPASVTFGSVSGASCSVSGQIVTCNLGDMPPVHTALVSSTFTTDADGWTLTNGAESSPTAVYTTTGGNPGGHIYGVDSGSLGGFYFVAPAKFLGDKSVTYGGTLNFDLRAETGGSGSPYILDDILLSDGNTTLTHTINMPPTTWTSYSLKLNETSGWENTATGQPPTYAEMLTILSNLTELHIRGEYYSSLISRDSGYLDNVMLTSGPAIITIVVTPTAAGTLANTASIASDITDPNLGNNSTTENTTVTDCSAPDATQGFVLNTDPPDGANNVPLHPTITITFDQMMNAATLTGANIQLCTNNSTPCNSVVATTLQIASTSVATDTVLMVPDSDLSNNGNYHIKIGPGVENICGTSQGLEVSTAFRTQ